jgi:hypothetical protein
MDSDPISNPYDYDVDPGACYGNGGGSEETR